MIMDNFGNIFSASENLNKEDEKEILEKEKSHYL